MKISEIVDHLEIVDHVRTKTTKPKAIQYTEMSRELFKLALIELNHDNNADNITSLAREQFYRAVYIVYRS